MYLNKLVGMYLIVNVLVGFLMLLLVGSLMDRFLCK